MKRLVAVLLAAAAGVASAGIEMGTPFSDGAVLQRGMKVPVWGEVSPPVSKMLRLVRVEFAGQKKTAEVGKDGRWRVDLDPMEASSEGRTMTISRLSPGLFFDSVEESVEVKDVLVGEVWFASGQSNMECPIWGPAPRYRDGNGALMVQKTHKPLVRFAKNDRNWSLEPEKLKAAWRRFDPESFNAGQPRTLSAVAFYYALELHDALGVPVGIVDSSWGGSTIGAWIPRDELARWPELERLAAYKVCRKEEWKKDPALPKIWCAAMQPGVLFDGMVAAYAPMAMRGMIWYQGEGNSGDGEIYAVKMHALCDGWSRRFENPGMKLYFCGFAPHNGTTWFNDVRAQAKFADEEPRAAISYLSDAGNPDDIHPNDKRVPAMRLALHALKRDYGFDVKDDSPSFESAKVEGDVVSIAFKDASDIYIYNRDNTLYSGFELAGEDGKFAKAEILNARKDGGYLGVIGGNVLKLRADGVAAPREVRYLANPPVKGAIYNEVNLPLGAFQKDIP